MSRYCGQHGVHRYWQQYIACIDMRVAYSKINNKSENVKEVFHQTVHTFSSTVQLLNTETTKQTHKKAHETIENVLFKNDQL